MQRIDRRDQGLFGLRPARRVGAAQHRGADLLVGEMRGGRKGRDVDAPFIFAPRQRAGAVDDDLALAQGERPLVQQAAGAEFLPGPRMAGDDAKQHQRRRAAHDAVELSLDFRLIRRLQRRNA